MLLSVKMVLQPCSLKEVASFACSEATWVDGTLGFPTPVIQAHRRCRLTARHNSAQRIDVGELRCPH